MRKVLAAAALVAMTGQAMAAPLSSYIGKYADTKVGGVSFAQHPAVIAAVTNNLPNPAPVLRMLRTSGWVAGPVERHGGMITFNACIPHDCPAGFAVVFDVNMTLVCYEGDNDDTGTWWHNRRRVGHGDCQDMTTVPM